MQITNVDELLVFLETGKEVKYLFFWGHQKPKSGVNQSCFSQWYDAPFTKDDVFYSTAEHFMMAGKALLFKDQAMYEKILQAKTPGEAKKLGRQIQGFTNDVWLQHRFGIVVEANLLKFSQNLELKQYLLNTQGRVLVEASPVDAIWGIGLAADNPDAGKPKLWQGLNLLGFALMVVRERLLQG
ncbi:MAG: NADAR family protein [Spirochaetota bacterium]